MKERIDSVGKDAVLRMSAFDGVQAILHPTLPQNT
jgi:hypothetical protein